MATSPNSDGDRPQYVPRRFVGASDRFDGDEWKAVWDGFDLTEPSGHIRCSECGERLHCYSASRDNPGHNEQIGDGYVMFNYEVAVCGGWLYEAFPSLRDPIDSEFDRRKLTTDE